MRAATEIGDPRLQALFGASDPRETSVRPAVPLPRKGLPPAALAAITIVFGLLLFWMLNSRRTQPVEESPLAATSPQGPAVWDAPPLHIPLAPVSDPRTLPVVLQPPALAPAPAPGPAVRVVEAPAPQSAFIPAMPPPMPMPRPPMSRPAGGGATALVIDSGGTTAAPAPPASVSGRTFADAGQGGGRVRASGFANRSNTVPQGYVIPAVLESGFDSTRPGFARAVVSRDVRGFDGKNVLIPRGSRLIGEYRSEVAAGQSRAMINWTRLIRPDGMTIAMDSPAVDPVGRGGVPATVNSHFFGRLGNAILQSTVSLGSNLIGRSTPAPVVVVPNAAAGAVTPTIAQQDFTPTLSVAPGKSISVFVAHDLDFTSAAGSQ